jgi:prepilin-type N-terminal cleavage/methylation domain-containing protein
MYSICKKGFTLVEMMVATSIATVIFGAIISTLIFCQRMFHVAMIESESSLALRAMRDRLLFHAGPGSVNGLLTGKIDGDSASIKVTWISTNLQPQSIRFVWRTDNGYDGGYFFNESLPHTPQNINWFKPGNFRLGDDWSAAVNLPTIHLALLNPLVGDIMQTSHINLPTALVR